MEALNTLFVCAMLENMKDGTVVGHVTVPAGKVKRETYEYAAWFRDHKMEPGTYEVVFRKYNGYPYFVLDATIDTTIVDACLISGFGGVHYGPDTAGQREIGKKSTIAINEYLGYSLDPSKRVTTVNGFEFVPCIW